MFNLLEMFELQLLEYKHYMGDVICENDVLLSGELCYSYWFQPLVVMRIKNLHIYVIGNR